MGRSDHQRRRVDDLLGQSPRPKLSPDSPALRDKCLARRLDKAQQAGLFTAASPWDRVSPTRVVAQMDRIAQGYGLVYVGEGNTCRWSAPRDDVPAGPETGRRPQWLVNLLAGGRGIDRLDLLLLGEVYRLPLESLELPDDREAVFDNHLKAARAGLNLLAPGFEFLCENTAFFRHAAGGPIEVRPDGERGVSAAPEAAEVRRGGAVTVVVPLPERFGRAQVALLERDADGDVSLLSPGRLVGHDPWFDGPAAVIPRAGKTMRLEVAGRSELVAVLAATDEPLLPLLDDGWQNALPVIGPDELDGLKSRLLTLDLERWCVKRQLCLVRDQAAG